VYLLIDACGENSIPPRMRRLGAQACSLYSGDAERDYWAVAPYLCQYSPDLKDWIVQHLPGKPWGYIVESPLSQEELRRHFRRFLMVEGPEGKSLYFRFYDPRVIQLFYESTTQATAKRFFGPLRRLILPTAQETWAEIIPGYADAEGVLPAKTVISQAELDALSARRRTQFQSELTKSLEADERVRGRWKVDELPTLVERGIERGLQYGLDDQKDVAGYVRAMLCLPPSIQAEQDPTAVRNLMQDRRDGPTTRIAKLEAWVASQQQPQEPPS
jgi:hypothetical protein